MKLLTTVPSEQDSSNITFSIMAYVCYALEFPSFLFFKISAPANNWQFSNAYLMAYTVRTIISAPPLQNAVSHITAIGEPHSSCIRSAVM
jgi:hypothetical protein